MTDCPTEIELRKETVMKFSEKLPPDFQSDFRVAVSHFHRAHLNERRGTMLAACDGARVDEDIGE